MRRFLYFFRGMSRQDAIGALRQHHAPMDAFEGEIFSIDVADAAAGVGLVIAAGPELPVFAPDHQRWWPSPDMWVGYETDAPPGPEDLARQPLLDGDDTTLAGGIWRVPKMPLDKTRGEFASKFPIAAPIDVRSLILEAVASRAFRIFFIDREARPDRLLALATQLLSINFRISIDEVHALSLLDAPGAARLLARAIDLPSLPGIRDSLTADGRLLFGE